MTIIVGLVFVLGFVRGLSRPENFDSAGPIVVGFTLLALGILGVVGGSWVLVRLLRRSKRPPPGT